jgi:hypothetical protein
MSDCMTRADQKTLFTALAFVSVLMKGREIEASAEAAQVRQLAALIESFCLENNASASTHRADEGSSSLIDTMIEFHIDELKRRQETRLPDDRDVLIKLYDRLQQRKMRRLQREFYASATNDKIADLALQLLDEEIEDDEALT